MLGFAFGERSEFRLRRSTFGENMRPQRKDEPTRKWDGEAEQSQQDAVAAPSRSRAIQELSSRPKQKARRLVLPASSADTGRAAEKRNSPSSGEDASARASERTADLPAPKAQTPLEEARRPSGQGRRYAAPTSVPATDRCFASKQVPFDDLTSGQEPSAQEKSGEEPSAQRTFGETPSAKAPSAQNQLEESAKNEGRKEETRVPLAQSPSALADRAEEAGPPEARSPTALDILAGSGAAVAAA
ncbi:hypothetical protein AXG93_4032s1000 [Marchantia polymorpha subsp. ruderalis]|uniref:Uncharacterized protein n=1 Tax=Marchantia polymorpha subsp. ruderalis TaxID=1480154 RepID=A0A176WLP4_MARPO|nr:hypothetical protein AXG93_4032s1000 [Marchantia polymorpha subsp. ruderalis]